LEAPLRLGYARPVERLSRAIPSREESAGLLSPLSRAFQIQARSADLLQVDPPRENALVLLESDVLPRGKFALEARSGGWDFKVLPWDSAAWKAPSDSGGRVEPCAYPANGRVAYYNLGRIWISDLDGRRMQSLQHVPLLEEGGRLFWDYGGTRLCWMGARGGAAAVELGVESLEEVK
jgi:hypothetical protein